MGVVMERFHPEQVRKIWQRVQSGPAYEPAAAPHRQAEVSTNLGELIHRESLKKGMLLQLSRRFKGKDAIILRKLSQQAQSHQAILRGICTMTEGTPPSLPTPKPFNIPTRVLLQRCYGQTLQSLSEYEQRESEPQFGSTFHKMALQQQEHCRILLALLGSISSKK